MHTAWLSCHERCRYWGAMRNATRVAYPPMDPAALPRLFDYSQCMEVDGQFFYR